VAALLQQAEVEKQQQEWRNGEESKQAGQTLVHGQLLKWK